MVDYSAIVQKLPPDLRETLLQLVGAVEHNLREQLASPLDVIVDIKALANGLVESQHASVQRLDRVESALLLLTEAQQRTEARMEQLTEAQQRTEARMEQLTEAQQRTEEGLDRLTIQVGELTDTVERMQPRLARSDGWQLEQRYIERAPSYFGRWLRQIEVLWPGRLQRILEQQLDDSLTPDEKEEVLRLDAILRGKTSLTAGLEEVYVALEASVTVNQYDVMRASERAALLRRTGVRVVAVVAGEAIDGAAEADAQTHHVAILQNGKRQGWEHALAAA